MHAHHAKQKAVYHQPYQNARQANPKKRNPTCVGRPMLGIPVSECVQILVGECVIDGNQTCICLTHANAVLATGKFPGI